LTADSGQTGGGKSDAAIAQTVGVHLNTVASVRWRFGASGPKTAVRRAARGPTADFVRRARFR
jgi:hypothetical protein